MVAQAPDLVAAPWMQFCDPLEAASMNKVTMACKQIGLVGLGLINVCLQKYLRHLTPFRCICVNIVQFQGTWQFDDCWEGACCLAALCKHRSISKHKVQQHG